MVLRLIKKINKNDKVPFIKQKKGVVIIHSCPKK